MEYIYYSIWLCHKWNVNFFAAAAAITTADFIECSRKKKQFYLVRITTEKCSILKIYKFIFIYHIHHFPWDFRNTTKILATYMIFSSHMHMREFMSGNKMRFNIVRMPVHSFRQFSSNSNRIFCFVLIVKKCLNSFIIMPLFSIASKMQYNVAFFMFHWLIWNYNKCSFISLSREKKETYNGIWNAPAHTNDVLSNFAEIFH